MSKCPTCGKEVETPIKEWDMGKNKKINVKQYACGMNMSKWREEIKILPCGCKIGRSKQGVWLYDYYCEKHVKELYVDGKFSLEKTDEMTSKINEEMKKRRRDENVRTCNETESSGETNKV